MKKNKVQKVKGVICTNWSDEFWSFQLAAGLRWDYDRMRHNLTCKGEQVASGIMCLGDAILFAQGYETGVADLTMKARRVMKACHDAGIQNPTREQYIAKMKELEL